MEFVFYSAFKYQLMIMPYQLDCFILTITYYMHVTITVVLLTI